MSYSVQTQNTMDIFMVGDGAIQFVGEQPVESVGRWHCGLLNGRCESKEIEGTLQFSLRTIERSGLPGKYMIWCYQFSFLPRLWGSR